MNQSKPIHARALRTNPDLLQTLLLNLLESNNLRYAHAVLTTFSPPPPTFLFNKLLQAYSYSSSTPSHLPFSLYSLLLRSRRPNPHSLVYLLSSRLSPLLGKALHAHLLLLGFPQNPRLSTALISFYARHHFVGSARKVFDEMPERDVAVWNAMVAGYNRIGAVEAAREVFDGMFERNVISWTAMVSGYAQNGRYKEALEVFEAMLRDGGVRPNEVTLASVLPACAHLGALETGGKIEGYARENGFVRNLFVGNALVEMYAKCGSIDDARRVFEEIGWRRNVCSWNSMIVGLAVHGKWKEALELFHDMLGKGLSPDDITFVGVLLACTHGGSVNQGRDFFNSMEKKFGIRPKLEHYGCMVDLLGRAGLLNDAYKLIKSMPMKPDSVVWGTLLGACSFHREIKLAEIAAEFLFDLEPWNPGNYVILSNIYASLGHWDGVVRLWKMKRGMQYKKAAGYSSIELDGIVHRFIVEDKSHLRCQEIYEVLDELQTRMKLIRDFLEYDYILICMEM